MLAEFKFFLSFFDSHQKFTNNVGSANTHSGIVDQHLPRLTSSFAFNPKPAIEKSRFGLEAGAQWWREQNRFRLLSIKRDTEIPLHIPLITSKKEPLRLHDRYSA